MTTKPPMTFCTYLTCPNGHRWFPDLAITTCPGCHAPLLALRLSNCPVCNEPSTLLNLRLDHTSRSIPIAPICQGAKTAADTGTLTIPLDAHKTVSASPPPNTQTAKIQKAIKPLLKP